VRKKAFGKKDGKMRTLDSRVLMAEGAFLAGVNRFPGFCRDPCLLSDFLYVWP